MASLWSFSPFSISNTSLTRKTIVASTEKPLLHRTQVTAAPVTSIPVRRSGNYPPSLWSYDKIQSLTSKYTGENHKPRLQTLKEEAKTMINKVFEEKENPLKMLNLVDDLQRLGIFYHFENEISNALKNIYNNYYDTPEKWTKLGLNLRALGFRLLRQHGYDIPQEIFEDIKDEAGNIKEGELEKDTEGMLNLYEASYYLVEDEDILDDARDFTTKYLKHSLENKNVDGGDRYLSSLISHALDIPLNWMVPRVETRWFIEAYETRTDMNSRLLEFAKLDFNVVQAIHLEDLKDTSEWWTSIRWDSNLSFFRDRVVENFLWTVGVNPLPQFSPLRRVLARVFALITTFDDVYDVYGTLEELEQFTNAIGRWDINSIDELPEYMKLCFIGFYNSINEIAYYTLTDTGFFNLPYLKKAWEDLCKAYLKEAQWYYSGYMPTFEEYLETACMSISVPLMLMHISFFTSVSSTEEILRSMEKTKKIIHYSAMVLRLADDLGTSSEEVERGDTPKSVQCYMHETGATEEEARMFVKKCILDTYKKLNKERSSAVHSQFLKEFAECGTNFGRMAQFMYHVADGHGTRPDVTRSHVLSLLVNPII